MKGKDPSEKKRILSKKELKKTLSRLAAQILEKISDVKELVILGIPTRGIPLAEVLARELEKKTDCSIDTGIIDPTFHRDDLDGLGTKISPSTNFKSSLEGRQVLLVDDVIFTGRTVRAAIESLQAWGRPQRVMLLVMVDRSGYRELPIQPDFFGCQVTTETKEKIVLKLMEIDGEDGVYLI